MRIVMVHPHDLWRFPWTIRMIALAGALAKRGHQVTVAYVPARDVLHRPVLRQPPSDGVRYMALGPRWRHFRRNVRTLRKLAREADVVHFQKCLPAAALPALWAAWLERKPTHYDWDDNETEILHRLSFDWFYRQLIAVMEQSLLQLADSVSVASRRLFQLALDRSPNAQLLAHIPVGANVPQQTNETVGRVIRRDPRWKVGQRQMVLYVGQLEGAAYVDEFLQAAVLVRASLPEVCLVVVGGGRLLPSLRHAARQLGLTRHVIFTGYVPASQVSHWITGADVCIATFEDNEAAQCKSPLKIVEYMAAGKAVVASAVGEARHMLKDCALLVPPGQPKMLADAILRLLSNEGLRRELGAAARQRVRDLFSWDQLATRLEDIYFRVTAEINAPDNKALEEHSAQHRSMS